jgi:hypothetical protein
VRYRFENVDQDGMAVRTNAHTVQNNFGFKTDTFKSFRALDEIQIVQDIGMIVIIV